MPSSILRAPSPADEPRGASDLARWRRRRDLVIALAAKGGASQELLADVFDLAQPRICQILKRRKEAHAQA